MYLIVNDRYAQHSLPVRDWEEFCEMCEECFGADFEEPDSRERLDGSIETRHDGSWELTLVPVN